jgi:hypothetical protein
MSRPPFERLDISQEELNALLLEAKAVLNAESYAKLEKMLSSLVYLTALIEDRQTTLAKLRRLIFGSQSEKSRHLFKDDDKAANPATAPGTGDGEPAESGNAETSGGEAGKKRPGHGRNGAEEYTGGQRIKVSHPSLQPKDRCPGCRRGKVYVFLPPGFIVRIIGQAPLAAKIWELEKLRCNLCGEIFTAEPPPGLGAEKYDHGAKAMIAILRYGTGLPMNRLERLEDNFGIPLPASTQFEIVEDLAEELEPAHQELKRQAAQGELLHSDDTTMKILALDKARRAQEGQGKDRTGTFTTGIVSVVDEHRVALFFTGPKHAGENMTKVLAQRDPERGIPIHMCDALAREPEQPSQLANCLAHGRRKFAELLDIFPPQCRRVLESLRQVYLVDKRAAENGLSAEARLRLHQAESQPVMDNLRQWMQEQFTQRLVEPNSGLGQAINYMLKHWEPLTLFLRQAGAPLDNNACERALKKAILHRNNSLFYKTQNGAQVGDLFMSLIHTCELNDVNAFEYLVRLQENADRVEARPADWMPWNYRAALEAVDST